MITRSLEKAKEAYKKRDIELTKKAHLHHGPEQHQQESGQYIKSIVYGGLDGTITTFAVVAGVAGASLSAGIVLILGFANLIADGISMAVGDYLSTKAESEYQKAERKREQWEVEHYPEGEKKEMYELYCAKGFSKEQSKKLVDILSTNKKAWIDTMMIEELGIMESDESPLKNAFATFLSFGFFGLIPLLAYVFAKIFNIAANNTFTTAIVLTGVTLFALGAVKTKVTGQNWFRAGSEMLVVGGIAAAAAFIIGKLLSGLA